MPTWLSLGSSRLVDDDPEPLHLTMLQDVHAAVDDRSAGTAPRRSLLPQSTYRGQMFLFFSNRLGCLGSLAISAALTLLILLFLGVL